MLRTRSPGTSGAFFVSLRVRTAAGACSDAHQCLDCRHRPDCALSV